MFSNKSKLAEKFSATIEPAVFVGQDNDRLDKLAKLTDELPPLREFVLQTSVGGIQEYETTIGTVLGFGIIKEDNVAVARLFFSENTEAVRHAHEESEYLIVVSGALWVETDEGRQVVLPGKNPVYLAPQTGHRIGADEDTWIVAITVPCCKEFPNA